MKIVICGGGNITHALAAKLSLISGIEVCVMTRKPHLWNDRLTVTDVDGNKYLSGYIESDADYSKHIPDADIIIVSAPSFAIKDILNNIAPYYNKKSWIGSVQCSGGFFWSLSKYLGDTPRHFGFQRVPYISRTEEYGKRVHIKGDKKQLDLYYNQSKNGTDFLKLIQSLFASKINLKKHYLEISISNSNPILHPARLFSMFSDWNTNKIFPQIPFFYEDWDDNSSEILAKCDNELSNIIRAVPIDLSSIKTIFRHYEVKSCSELTDKLRNIEAFKGIKTDMCPYNGGYIPNIKSRYFTEDIPYGLYLIKGLALLTDTKVPNIDNIIFWAQKLLNLELLNEDNSLGKDSKNYPLPQTMNINCIDELTAI